MRNANGRHESISEQCDESPARIESRVNLERRGGGVGECLAGRSSKGGEKGGLSGNAYGFAMPADVADPCRLLRCVKVQVIAGGDIHFVA